MGIFNARYKQEEKEKFAQIMLERLFKADYVKEIAADLGIGENDAHRIKNKLIEEGKITQEQIDSLVEERKQREKIEFLQNDEDIQKILVGLRAGRSCRAISKDVRFSASRVTQYVEELIKLGMITREEIEEAKQNKKAEPKPKIKEPETKNKIEEIKYRILELLEIGISTKQIRNMLEISLETFTNMKNELIAEGKITKQAIDKAVIDREKRSTEITYQLLKQGYNFVEISACIPYSDRRYVERLAKALKESGRITEEEINEARAKREEQREDYIIQKLEQGLNIIEISQTDGAKALKLTEPAIRYAIDRMQETGKITEEDNKRFEESRKARPKKRENEMQKSYDDSILTLTRLGFDPEQILEVTGLSRTYMFERKRKLKEQGLLDIKNPRKLISNREKEAKKRRRNISKMVVYEKDLEGDTVRDQIEYARAKTELGELDPEDMDLISMAIPMDHDLMTLRNINFVIKHYNDAECLEFAVDFINRCLESARDRKEEERLTEMKAKIERKMAMQKSSRMSKRNKWVCESIKANPRIVVKLPEEQATAPKLEETER